MISIAEMQDNLLRGYEMTSEAQRMRGRVWYAMAHDLAHVIGHGNVRLGAGLLAATSPNKGWNDNRRIAINVTHGIYGGQVQNALDKARKIMEGCDPTEVLPMHKKTGHFFMNILDPFDSMYVTVDRHAIRAATWDWDTGEPRVTEKQYRDLVLAFQGAAYTVGKIPCVFQAELWTWAREHYVPMRWRKA